MDGFTVKFYQTLKEDQIKKMFSDCSTKQKGKGHYQTFSMEPMLPWYQNQIDKQQQQQNTVQSS